MLQHNARVLRYLSTTANEKGIVAYASNGAYYNYYMRRGLSAKNNASVTLNLIWRKVTATAPELNEAHISYDDIVVVFSSYYIDSDYKYEVEYSTNPLFITIEDVDTSRHYYVRARQLALDSTGEYNVKSKWTPTIKVSTVSSY